NYLTPAVTVIGNVGRTDPVSIIVGDPARSSLSVPTNVVASGTNVLAVSLHQITGTTDPSNPQTDVDKAFGAELKARVQSFVIGPVIIASGPGDRIVIEGQPVTLEVFSAGASRFQWQRVGANGIGTNIAGANVG